VCLFNGDDHFLLSLGKLVQKELLAMDQLTLRHDWYSSGADVICVNFYSKALDKTKSNVVFSSSSLKVDLFDKDGKRYTKEFQLAAVRTQFVKS